MTVAISLPDAPAAADEREARALENAFMQLALDLGRRGTPAPNPHVGAVVVREQRVVGAGFHERAGEAHAEAVAIACAGTAAAGATLYVTLEPCNHHGRTPPCVEGIVRAGIRRVVIGCPDPNPFVAGGGAFRLQCAGVEVIWSNRLEEARALIADWTRALDMPREGPGCGAIPDPRAQPPCPGALQPADALVALRRPR